LQNFFVASTDNNEIYFNVVEGRNKKGMCVDLVHWAKGFILLQVLTLLQVNLQ